MVLAASFFVWSGASPLKAGATVADIPAGSCPTGTEAELYSDCVVWQAGGYGDKIGALQKFSDGTAMHLCDELLEQYPDC